MNTVPIFVEQQGSAQVLDLDRYPKVYLQTGDCFLAVKPTLVTTVLGSCVAVTLCDPVRGRGAICHAFLPSSQGYEERGRDPQVCRFVDTALENMFASFMRLRIDPSQLVVKLFGGASGIMTAGRGNLYDIGGRNVRAVREGLMARGVRIAKAETGGVKGRKLLYLTHTGDVWVKRLNNSCHEV